MNTHTIGIVIKREYLNRVKKKSFLIITFIVPLLFAAMCCIPALIMTFAKDEAKKIAVVDFSGIVLPQLQDNESAAFTDLSAQPLDSVKANLKTLGYDAVLAVSPLDSASKSVSAEVFSLKPLGVELDGAITRKINSAVEDYRLATYGIDNLKSIMQEVESNVKVMTYTLGDDGKEKVSEAGIYSMISLVLGMVLYMFIAMFSAMVMSSVIEEKSSRVIEVLISSVRAIDLMFGKIIGIALVALTQFLLWIVLSAAIIGVAGSMMGPELLAGVSAEAGSTVAGVPGVEMSGAPSEVAVIISSLANLNISEILISFVIYFVLGYMLYASLFAAIGSAVENEGDSSQLQIPVTIPLMLAMFVGLYACKAPDSGIVFWTSMIPFTSPIVMLARLPFGVPAWELWLSIGLLLLTFIACAWVSARIYRAGVLVFGKKSTFKDLFKWLKQK